MLGWYDPLPDRWKWVLVVLLGLAMLAVVLVILLGVLPDGVASWNNASGQERDTVLLILLVFLLFTQRRCKCSGRCGK